MSALSEKDGMTREFLQLQIANRLMDEELLRLQPELTKYENCVHPAAKAVQAEAVSTSSLTEKTKEIKLETANLKVIENHLSTLNDQVTTVFKDVETKISHRESLFSEIEQATSMMNSLTVASSQFEEDVVDVRKAVHEETNKMISVTTGFQNKMKENLARLAALKKTQSDVDRLISIKQQSIQMLLEKKAENESKVDLDSLAKMREKLGEITEKTANLQEYLVSVTKDEGRKMEILRATITESEILMKKKSDLSNQLDEIKAREDETIMIKESKEREVEESKRKMNELKSKKEQLSTNYETVMNLLKERTDPLIESLKVKKDTVGKTLEEVKKRIVNREECLRLRKELDAEGKIVALDLSEEIKSLKQEIENSRAHITKSIGEAELYRSAADRYNAEADALQVSNRTRRVDAERRLHEKDGVANHFEMEVFNLKKKLEREKIEREDRLAQETRRLLEKAKEDKERKEKEEKRRIEKEKEKAIAKEEKEKKLKTAREEQEKRKKEEQEKKKKAREEQERKKKEEHEKMKKEEQEKRRKEQQEKKKMIDQAINRAQNEDNAMSAIISQVQQRRLSLEAAASVPFAHNDASLMRPTQGVAAPLPSTQNLRPRSVPKKPMFIFDDDSSEDDEDDMSDFLMDDSIRVMPKVPEKYAGSPPQVGKMKTPLNSFELSFTDAQSSTPARMLNAPTPASEISFNNVETSTPQVTRGSKANKKQNRPRGKKRTK